jgi:hypothetical protein
MASSSTTAYQARGSNAEYLPNADSYWNQDRGIAQSAAMPAIGPKSLVPKGVLAAKFTNSLKQAKLGMAILTKAISAARGSH